MKTAYILGGAQCVWADAAKIIPGYEDQGLSKPLPAGDIIVAVNDVGVHWRSQLDVWASLHGWQILRQWMPRRAANGFSAPLQTISGLDAGDQAVCKNNLTLCTEAKFDGQLHAGSSGLFAVKIALTELECDRAILCGIPMTDMPHFFASPDDHPLEGKPDGWQSATSYWEGWKEAKHHLDGRCFSMSGWTSEFLGFPPDYTQAEMKFQKGGADKKAK